MSIRQGEVTSGTSLGHTAYLSVETKAIAQAAIIGTCDVDRDREVVMRNLLSTAAGPLAQAKYMERLGWEVPFNWAVFGGERDRWAAKQLMSAAGDLLHVRDLDDVVSEARNLLEVPETWEAVERVADELLRFGELEFLDVHYAVLGLG